MLAGLRWTGTALLHPQQLCRQSADLGSIVRVPLGTILGVELVSFSMPL